MRIRVCGRVGGNKEVGEWCSSIEEFVAEYNEFESGRWDPIWVETDDGERLWEK